MEEISGERRRRGEICRVGLVACICDKGNGRGRKEREGVGGGLLPAPAGLDAWKKYASNGAPGQKDVPKLCVKPRGKANATTKPTPQGPPHIPAAWPLDSRGPIAGDLGRARAAGNLTAEQEDRVEAWPMPGGQTKEERARVREKEVEGLSGVVPWFLRGRAVDD
ncbi:hypothetical protein IF1G_00700 [Cordyceps javanica]|uniref:Uncharacterized protein n=1 Tax=Cordyceps javanica TaxID=43265 RepID=A0A545VGB3_9HYPO|nr:hypothetical protein IF1G_00700 [Cordyceps javanica]